MRPKRPWSTACLSSWSVRLRRFCLTTNSRTPASSQARTIARPSLQRVAIGFSVMMSRPARATSMACAGCRPLGVVRITQSAWVVASIDSEVGVAHRAGALHSRRQRIGVHVAHVGQFAAAGVRLDRLEMVVRDPAAARQRETDLAVGDGGPANVHARECDPARPCGARRASNAKEDASLREGQAPKIPGRPKENHDRRSPEPPTARRQPAHRRTARQTRRHPRAGEGQRRRGVPERLQAQTPRAGVAAQARRPDERTARAAGGAGVAGRALDAQAGDGQGEFCDACRTARGAFSST